MILIPEAIDTRGEHFAETLDDINEAIAAEESSPTGPDEKALLELKKKRAELLPGDEKAQEEFEYEKGFQKAPGPRVRDYSEIDDVGDSTFTEETKAIFPDIDE